MSEQPISLKKGSEVTFTIDDAAYQGKGVGRINNIPIFVKNTAPGDVVKAMIIKKKKKFREAKLIEVLEPSSKRITPTCKHATVCGGCNWQHVDYQTQLEFKRQHVADHITRIGKLPDVPVLSTLPSTNELHYRNKMEYSFGDRRWLTREEIQADEHIDDKGFAAGMHAPGRFDKILNLDECYLQEEISFKLLALVRDYAIEHGIEAYNPYKHVGFLRNLVVRTSHHTDDIMVNIVTNRDDDELVKKIGDHILEHFPEVTTIVNNVNDTKSPVAEGRIEKIVFGPGYITDSIGPFRFQIHANAFFQTNTLQAERLYEVGRNFAEISEDDLVYDLYCGVGTLTLFLSEQAKHVVGIEFNPVAIKNAEKNKLDNNVENVSFVTGDMKDTFNKEMLEKFGKPDVLITDPPRAGMHPDVIEELKELKVKRIVYISCNSSTQARDLEMLSDLYDVEEVKPVDMFPQTYHVESVAKLTLK